MNKSYVTLELNQCFVCLEIFDTGTILLDKYLKKSFDHKTLTGYGLCPSCQSKKDEGYIAMIEAEPSSNPNSKEPNRTGRIIHIRESAFQRIFNSPLPKKKIAFIDKAAAAILENIPQRN